VTREEFQSSGVTERDLKSLSFTDSSSDHAVNEVLQGRVLEQLTLEGKLDLSEIRVLNRRKESDFPFLLSSELYPEFAFLGTGHVPRELATQVTAELLLMPHDATSGYTLGWSIPENYHRVQQLMQKWRMPPLRAVRQGDAQGGGPAASGHRGARLGNVGGLRADPAPGIDLERPPQEVRGIP